MTWLKPLRAITLDLDDTLWAVGPTLVAAEKTLGEWLQANAPRTGAHLTAETRALIRKQVLAEHPDQSHDLGFLRQETLRRAMLQAGDPSSLAADAYAVFLDARQRVTFFDDVLPVLANWSQRYRLVAVSNGNADIARVGLDRYFVGAVSAHELGCAKPDPRMFHEACRVAGALPSEVLHIGDDPHLDVLAARAAGLQAAWIRRPQFAHRHADEALDAQLTPAFEDLHALDAVLHGPQDAGPGSR